MAIQLVKKRFSGSNRQTVVLLRELGVEVPQGAGREFWLRDPHELLFFLDSARAAFRTRAKSVPTTLTANHEDSIALIKTWKTVQKNFKKHGIELFR